MTSSRVQSDPNYDPVEKANGSSFPEPRQKNNKPSQVQSVEQEQQFLLRLPENAANLLNELLDAEQAVVNAKYEQGNEEYKEACQKYTRIGHADFAGKQIHQRFELKLEPELVKNKGKNQKKQMVSNRTSAVTQSVSAQLRRGNIKLDNFVLNAKLLELATIIESQKTIDQGKTFYKTSDISQILIASEDPILSSSDDSSGEDQGDASANSRAQMKRKLKNEQRENNKKLGLPDPKYLHPHGICEPLKNCRRRRFRKTKVRDTNVGGALGVAASGVLTTNGQSIDESPEQIEKEVKRLLRVDLEAVDVTWELIDDPQALEDQKRAKTATVSTDCTDKTSAVITDGKNNSLSRDSNVGAATEKESGGDLNDQVNEQHLFGELSDDSEDESQQSSIKVEL